VLTGTPLLLLAFGFWLLAFGFGRSHDYLHLRRVDYVFIHLLLKNYPSFAYQEIHAARCFVGIRAFQIAESGHNQ
jgi:hypothetical protein